jgi:hypothetical protein
VQTALCSGLRWLLVACVITLCGGIATFGTTMILPRICTTWATLAPNAALAGLLLVQILANYIAAVQHPAGSVADIIASRPPAAVAAAAAAGGDAGDDGDSAVYIAQGAFDLWVWCKRCNAPKPPGCHHCARCDACVVDMSHHCPFLNNCVGRGNLRPFLLFLVHALVAAAYILVMCSLLLAHSWRDVQAAVAASRSGGHWGGAHHGHGGAAIAAGDDWAIWLQQRQQLHDQQHYQQQHQQQQQQQQASGILPTAALFVTTGLFFWLLSAAPWWLLAAFYLIAVAVGVLLALGMLLASELYYMGVGVSYIDALKRGQQQQQHEQQRWVAWWLGWARQMRRRLWAVLSCEGALPGWRALLVPGVGGGRGQGSAKKVS